MEAKTVINLTIDSYNNNDPKHGLRGVPGLAPNLITKRKEQQMKYQHGNYKVTFTSENSIEIDDIKNNKTIFIDNSTEEQIVSVEGDFVYVCKKGTNDRII